MIPMPSRVRVWIATGHTDMRRGMQGLALQVQEQLKRDPHGGDLYLFRGRRGDLAKILWHEASGCRSTPSGSTGKVYLAVGEGGCRVDLAGADGLHAGRNRLEESELTWRPKSAAERDDGSAGEAKKNMGSPAF